MILTTKRLNRFLMLATAPFVGIIFCLLVLQQPLAMDFSEPTEHYVSSNDIWNRTEEIKSDLNVAKTLAESTSSSLQKTTELYKSTSKTMESIANMTAAQAKKPEAVYNRRIQTKLGVPSEVIDSDRIRIELYKVNPGTYQGYAMKIKLKDPSAMQMALDDELGSSQTTLQAALRSGAVAGINAGGYADSGGERFPLGTTVQDGKYVTGFHPSVKDLSFVGMNKEGKLIGGRFFNKYALDQQEPIFGATFVPMLMKNGNKTVIPSKWKNTPRLAPRTVIGNYKDDQLLILVVDGYDEKGSSGATLEELQHKMYTLGVQDAYNLDGGGSASLILDGRVVNQPSDGNLRKVPTHFLFYE
ncbi:phosphodiester glycosidase family protein [Paenibacillus sp. Marseille-Q4541]|uniref:phosphodiester glycosidase family protein n=1 Tax=Paenibacillus sp. Marseille-Q4541 TaxID=2831522 RepID=UPI001BA8B9FF|nr:phosphodiester glycosidase family protein [Paenibacillus sp. Marseille-Q4541]